MGVDLYHSGLAGFDECLTTHQGCGHLTISVTCRSSKVNVPKEKLQLFGIQLVRILRMVEEEELSAQHGFSGLSVEHPRVDEVGYRVIIERKMKKRRRCFCSGWF